MTEDRSEIPKPHEYYLELARTLPKLPIDDPGVQEVITARKRGEHHIPEGWGPYGNTFFILFDGLRMDRSSPRFQKSLQRRYVEEVEALGEPWRRFLSENKDLLEEIDEAFEANNPYWELEDYALHLANTRQFDKHAELDKATGHPLGLNAVQQAAWARMNPLLERAGHGMQAVGINPMRFG
ncbi:MAG: hypothetical protein UU21_C0001G0003 [Candidatus Levybacteria bacterium GW2011_GWA2_40_8]|nr:MAG: hypothetical protein UU21_C0001G0003 [Candidatus Levybacteria bacterium GW2011_GWA2_40_8]